MDDVIDVDGVRSEWAPWAAPNAEPERARRNRRNGTREARGAKPIRDAQCNFRMSDDLKQEVEEAIASSSLSKVDFFEKLWRFAMAHAEEWQQ